MKDNLRTYDELITGELHFEKLLKKLDPSIDFVNDDPYDKFIDDLLTEEEE
jgi:hypothetical protein